MLLSPIFWSGHLDYICNLLISHTVFPAQHVPGDGVFSWLDDTAAAHKALQHSFKQKPPCETRAAVGTTFSGVITWVIFEMTFRAPFHRLLAELRRAHASCRLCSRFPTRSALSPVIYARGIAAVPHWQEPRPSCWWCSPYMLSPLC